MALEGIAEPLIENSTSPLSGKKKYLSSNLCPLPRITILISAPFIGLPSGLVAFTCIRKGNNKREMRFKRYKYPIQLTHNTLNCHEKS